VLLAVHLTNRPVGDEIFCPQYITCIYIQRTGYHHINESYELKRINKKKKYSYINLSGVGVDSNATMALQAD
jgi:hypothetical protein